jgi:hypothetical protein
LLYYTQLLIILFWPMRRLIAPVLGLVASSLMVFQFAVLPAQPLAAQTVGQDISEQLQPVADIYGDPQADEGTLARTVAQIIRIILGFLGIIFIVLIIYAGLLWMTSAGNEDKIEKAKKIISAAIIGVVIIFLAYAITAFVFNILLDATGISEGGLDD